MSALTQFMATLTALRDDGLPGNAKLYRVHVRYETEGGEWKWDQSQLVTRNEAIKAGTAWAGGEREVKVQADAVAVDRHFREADRRRQERG